MEEVFYSDRQESTVLQVLRKLFMPNHAINPAISHVSDAIAVSFPNINEIDKSAAQRIIARYTAAIAGNFVPWMAAAAVSARSIEARFVCETNIRDEMQENHPGLLYAFAKSANALPAVDDSLQTDDVIHGMRTTVAQMNGLKNIAIMAVCENASLIFIPFLAALAQKCNGQDFRYTDIHGVADKEHAEKFLWALNCEMAAHENAESTVEEAATMLVNFFKGIFAK